MLRPSGRPNQPTKLPVRYRDGAQLPRRRRPALYHDEFPAQPPPIISPHLSSPSAQSPNPTPDDQEIETSSPDVFQTMPDIFGVYRIYPGGQPPYTPDGLYTISDSFSCSNPIASKSILAPQSLPASFNPSMVDVGGLAPNSPTPFENMSVLRLMSWFYTTSNTKSHAELDRLVNDVILTPDFSPDDLIGFRAAKEVSRMDEYLSSVTGGVSQTSLSSRDKWNEASVFIPLPCDGVKHASEADAPKLEVKGLYHRRIVEVIRSALAEPAAQKFHLFPFKEYWKPSPHEPPERIYSEAFTADFFLEQYENVRVNAGPTRPGSSRNRIPVVIGIMFWSDSTHLASFGTASLWPIYLYFGNQSKYTRAKPSEFAAHHLAYVPKVCSISRIAYKSNVNLFSLVTMFKRLINLFLENLQRLKCSLIYAERLCRQSGCY